jgi:hypothetical protein
MRCPECGEELGALGSAFPCPECGVRSTQAERRPLGEEEAARLRRRLWFPILAAALVAVLTGLAVGGDLPVSGRSRGALPEIGMSAFAFELFLVPPAIFINTALVVRKLQRAVPRRVRDSKVLLLRRETWNTLLAALGSAILTAVLIGGGCICGGYVTG